VPTRNLKKGVELLSEIIGDGPIVQRHAYYKIKERMWLHRGDPVRFPPMPGIPESVACVDDAGTALTHEVRIDRVSMIAGLFYGIQGMRVGGTRVIRIAPHLAYGAEGHAHLMIPPNAILTVELSVIGERAAGVAT
jgi:hypothetical protein